jgi:hypothetical protein
VCRAVKQAEPTAAFDIQQHDTRVAKAAFPLQLYQRLLSGDAAGASKDRDGGPEADVHERPLSKELLAAVDL